MVKCLPTHSLDAVFSALADPTRRAIVARLAEGEASVSELAEPFAVSLPAVTKHLAVLERAGLLEHHKAGRVRHCRLVAATMHDAENWLSSYRAFSERHLDPLAQKPASPISSSSARVRSDHFTKAKGKAEA